MFRRTYRFLLEMLLLAQINSAIELDNGLLGTPEVSCKTDTIEMAFRTKKPFKGKVFVKGHYSNPECRVDYSKTDSKGQPIDAIKLNHGQCDMDRQRTVHPDGMQFSTILVISFHPLFITKVDRAFHVKCLYKETATTISSNLEVSALPTESITYTVPMPMCTYTIRKDEIDGPILRYARVGDQVVHRWEYIYGILVHSCYVEDGQGEKQLIIDENGCHKDKTLLGGPTYVKALNMAYREAFVFKFADRVVVRFQCEIRLCLKDGHGCDSVTPPICDENNVESASTIAPGNDSEHNEETRNYYRRSIRRVRNVTRPTIETDLISQSIYVLDANDDKFNSNENGTVRSVYPSLILKFDAA
uniref:ZP domain-containing protein n=1 Tax=Syphacia muris TaxID=451379 RepID=A0A0N5AN64_9BILA